MRFVLKLSLVVSLVSFTMLGSQAQGDPAPSAAGSAKRAKATISVLPWPGEGVVGYVESGSKKCMGKRKVTLFEKLDGGRLVSLGTARAKLKSGGYQWLMRIKGGPVGDYVAEAAKTARCKRAKKVESIEPKGPNGYPICPSLEDICQFTEMHVEEDGRSVAEPECHTGFGRLNPPRDYDGWSSCLAQSESGPEPWCCWEYAHAKWNNRLSSQRDIARTWAFYTKYQAKDSSAYIYGTLPHTDSARFTVVDALARKWHVPEDTYYRTPDLPGKGPGEVGGPLYFDFHPPTVSGFDFYIRGYLYRKK